MTGWGPKVGLSVCRAKLSSGTPARAGARGKRREQWVRLPPRIFAEEQNEVALDERSVGRGGPSAGGCAFEQGKEPSKEPES